MCDLHRPCRNVEHALRDPLVVLLPVSAGAGWRSALYIPDNPPGPVVDVTAPPSSADDSGPADVTGILQQGLDALVALIAAWATRPRRRFGPSLSWRWSLLPAAAALMAGCQYGPPDQTCEVDAGALAACLETCDDGDMCTAEHCAPDGTCRHVRNCVEPTCWTPECSWAGCEAVCRDASESCWPGQTLEACSPSFTQCSDTPALNCDAIQTCSQTGACIASPRLLVTLSAVDEGAARVTRSRSETDDGFVARPVYPRTLVALPDARPGTEWLAELDAAGQVLRAEPLFLWAEPMGSAGNYAGGAGFPCLFYDCFGSQGPPWRFVGLKRDMALLRRSAGATHLRPRLGYVPLRPANGQWRVRVVTVHFEAKPTRPWGALVAATPPRCEPALDEFRAFWPEQADLWTGGRQSFSFEFVDEGAVRFPLADGGNSGFSDALVDQLRELFPLGSREVLLVAVDGAYGGVASAEAGVALVGGAYVSEWFSLPIAQHELGHLFGASDLYDFDSSDCAFEESVEIPGPNLYCGHGPEAMTIARLTARELGWLDMDGNPVGPDIGCQTLPGSAFPCDP